MKTTSILIVAASKYHAKISSLQVSPVINIALVGSVADAMVKMSDTELSLILLDVRMFEQQSGQGETNFFRAIKSYNIPCFFVNALAFTVDGSPILSCFGSGFNSLQQEFAQKNLELEVLRKELEEKDHEFAILSSVDALTGLFSRRYFDDVLLKEWKQARRANEHLSLLIISIDHFNEYTKCFGKTAADECLCKIAHGLYSAILRPVDIVCRYSGAEFSVILPHTDTDGGLLVASRMIDAVRHINIPHKASQTAKTLTISIGVSTMVPGQKLTMAALYDNATKALYEAKADGRNCIRIRIASA